jgi:hypothetical protein
MASIPEPDPSTSQNTRTREGIAETVETITKAIAIASVLSYIAGLLIVHVYLQQFGLRVFDLLRTEYAVVGAVWAFLMAGSTLFWMAWRTLRRRWRVRNPKWPEAKLMCVMLVVGLLTFSGIGCVATGLNGVQAGVFLGVIVWLIGLFNAKFLQLVGRAHDPIPSVSAYTSEVCLGVFVLLMMSLLLYSRIAYPYIEIGGATRQRIRFVVTESIAKSLHAIGICGTTTNPAMCGPHDLILETENAYFVALHEPQLRCVRVPKSSEIIAEYQ